MNEHNNLTEKYAYLFEEWINENHPHFFMIWLITDFILGLAFIGFLVKWMVMGGMQTTYLLTFLGLAIIFFNVVMKIVLRMYMTQFHVDKFDDLW